MSAAEAVLVAARAKGWRIVTAESCTGGMLAAALTDVPGSSDVFDQGVVSYSYRSKTAMLGVPEAMLADHGAVSEPVARAMAEGARTTSGADLALAVTGVAGPGGSEDKPEGLVWFAAASPHGTISLCREFGPRGRASVRAASVAAALDLARQVLADGP